MSVFVALLPRLNKLSELLKRLVLPSHPLSTNVIDKSKRYIYNTSFQITSSGVKQIVELNFILKFRIVGQLYCRIRLSFPGIYHQLKKVDLYLMAIKLRFVLMLFQT